MIFVVSLTFKSIIFMGIHIHIHHEGEGEILKSLEQNRELLLIIKSQISKLMSNTDQALADLALIKGSLVKIGGETSTLLQKITDLQNNAPADTPQSVLDSIADIKAQAQIVDDLVPDAPVTPAETITPAP